MRDNIGGMEMTVLQDTERIFYQIKAANLGRAPPFSAEKKLPLESIGNAAPTVGVNGTLLKLPPIARHFGIEDEHISLRSRGDGLVLTNLADAGTHVLFDYAHADGYKNTRNRALVNREECFLNVGELVGGNLSVDVRVQLPYRADAGAEPAYELAISKKSPVVGRTVVVIQ
ncbi:MAG: hypothetical protein HYS81_01665 [Candidatus Aenigmatarchaeota archaeon]|nr:MAG: hypothetical protein HYS81_01665 [Candidatus Aenigmarchaeota archaeon]